VKPGETLYALAAAIKFHRGPSLSVNYIPWPYYVYANQQFGDSQCAVVQHSGGPVCAPQFWTRPVSTFTPAPPTPTPNPLYSNAGGLLAAAITTTCNGGKLSLGLRGITARRSIYPVRQSQHHQPEPDLRGIDPVYPVSQ